jgi:hypothetical protein
MGDVVKASEARPATFFRVEVIDVRIWPGYRLSP